MLPIGSSKSSPKVRVRQNSTSAAHQAPAAGPPGRRTRCQSKTVMRLPVTSRTRSPSLCTGPEVGGGPVDSAAGEGLADVGGGELIGAVDDGSARGASASGEPLQPASAARNRVNGTADSSPMQPRVLLPRSADKAERVPVGRPTHGV